MQNHELEKLKQAYELQDQELATLTLTEADQKKKLEEVNEAYSVLKQEHAELIEANQAKQEEMMEK